jgi:hypothetical protein
MGPNTTNLRCREDTAGALCTLRAGDNNSIFCCLLLRTSLTPSGEKSICLSLMLARHECSCVVLAFQLARASYVDLVRGPTCVPPVPVEHASKFLVLANGGPAQGQCEKYVLALGLEASTIWHVWEVVCRRNTLRGCTHAFVPFSMGCCVCMRVVRLICVVLCVVRCAPCVMCGVLCGGVVVL